MSDILLAYFKDFTVTEFHKILSDWHSSQVAKWRANQRVKSHLWPHRQGICLN